MTAGTKKRPGQQQLVGREVNPSAKGRMTMTSIAQNTDVRVYTEPDEGEERPLPHVAWSGREWRLWFHDENGEVDERLLAGGIKDAQFAVQQAVAHLATIPTPDIAKLLASIDTVPEGRIRVLDPGDPFYSEPITRDVRPFSSTRDAEQLRREFEAGLYWDYASVHFFTLSGRRVPLAERPAGWWEEQFAVTDRQDNLRFVEHMWGAVARCGRDFIAVGRGRWVVTGLTELDGEPAFELVEANTFHEEEKARHEEEKRTLLEQFPQIEDSKPEWAETADLRLPDLLDDRARVTYEQSIGPVTRAQVATLDRDTGDLKFDRPVLWVKEFDGGVRDFQKFAADVSAMAAAIKGRA